MTMVSKHAKDFCIWDAWISAYFLFRMICRRPQTIHCHRQHVAVECLKTGWAKLRSVLRLVLRWKWIHLPMQEMQETQVQSLCQEDPLEEEIATTPVFLPGEFQGLRNLVATVLEVAKRWTRLSPYVYICEKTLQTLKTWYRKKTPSFISFTSIMCWNSVFFKC